MSGISIAILTSKSRKRLYRRLAQLAESKTKIYFDYNYRPHLWKTTAEGIEAYEAILPWCDTVFVGLDELAALHGVTTTEAGHKYLAGKGVRESVVRSGAEFCSIQVGLQHFDVPPEKVAKVVDTTAAGDSFSGAYMLARNTGCSVEKAAKIAHRMAAYVIGHKGAVAPLNALPDFGDMS